MLTGLRGGAAATQRAPSTFARRGKSSALLRALIANSGVGGGFADKIPCMKTRQQLEL
jgi:hypothetical protein